MERVGALSGSSLREQVSYFVLSLSGEREQVRLLIYSDFNTLLNHLYGGMDEPELKIIDVFICKLRKKLSAALEGENYIETVWGRGYVLREPMPEQGRLVVGA